MICGYTHNRTSKQTSNTKISLRSYEFDKSILANRNRVIGAGIAAGALLIIILMTPAYAQKLARGASCNCIIDLTTNGGGHITNITGLTIPEVKLLKNETLMSQTEGRLSWIAIKSTQLIGVLIDGIFLGNFTGTGTSSTVALNTIHVKPNESLGVQISGGTIPSPTAVKVEIVKAKVNVNGTLEEIRTAANNTVQLYLHYNNMIKKPVLGINQFLINVKQSSYYLLLVSLGYDINPHSNNNNINFNNAYNKYNFLGNGQFKYPLIAIFESVLNVG